MIKKKKKKHGCPKQVPFCWVCVRVVWKPSYPMQTARKRAYFFFPDSVQRSERWFCATATVWPCILSTVVNQTYCTATRPAHLTASGSREWARHGNSHQLKTTSSLAWLSNSVTLHLFSDNLTLQWHSLTIVICAVNSLGIQALNGYSYIAKWMHPFEKRLFVALENVTVALT